MKFFVKDCSSKWDKIRSFLVTFTEEVLNGNFFFCAVWYALKVNPGGYYILTFSPLFYFLEGTELNKYAGYTTLYGHSRVT